MSKKYDPELEPNLVLVPSRALASAIRMGLVPVEKVPKVQLDWMKQNGIPTTRYEPKG